MAPSAVSSTAAPGVASSGALQSSAQDVTVEQLPSGLGQAVASADKLDLGVATGAIRGQRMGDCELTVDNKSEWSIRIYLGKALEGVVAPFQSMAVPVDAGNVKLTGVAQLSGPKHKMWQQEWTCTPKRNTTWTLLQ